MRCFNRIACGFQVNEFGDYVGRPCFVDNSDSRNNYVASSIDCGYCLPCLLRKRAQQTFLTHAQISRTRGNSTFITLTYNDDYLPPNRLLNYYDLSFFFKRLKEFLSNRGLPFSFPYTYSGELGTKTKRPHYHAILYGVDLLDLFKSRHLFNDFYTSSLVEHLWPFGYNLFCPANSNLCAYTVGYTVKKCVALSRDVNDVEAYAKYFFKCRLSRKKREKEYLDKVLSGKGFLPYTTTSCSYIDVMGRFRCFNRKIVNSAYPKGRCCFDKITNLYVPTEKVYLGRIANDFYNENKNIIFDAGYVVDPTTNVKYNVPIKFVNKMKNENVDLWRLYKQRIRAYCYAEDCVKSTDVDERIRFFDRVARASLSSRSLDNADVDDFSPFDSSDLDENLNEFVD